MGTRNTNASSKKPTAHTRSTPTGRSGRNGCFVVGARHQGGTNFPVGARSRSRMEESGPPR
eukprot:4220968-Prymnesium_polylepis.1